MLEFPPLSFTGHYMHCTQAGTIKVPTQDENFKEREVPGKWPEKDSHEAPGIFIFNQLSEDLNLGVHSGVGSLCSVDLTPNAAALVMRQKCDSPSV